jgi:PAS domain S-box-containing protein
MGEDAAIEGLTQGATDYVLKQKLSRLAPAVRRALHEAEDRRERKWAEEALRESEEHFRAVAESANDGIISANSQGNILYWNKAASVMFGYTEEEILGQSLAALMPGRYRDPYHEGMKRWTASGERPIGRVMETVGRRKDGREFPIELSIGNWKTREGTFFTGIVRDITERKQITERLHLQSEALQAAANGIVITDREGTIIWVNSAFTRLTGYIAQEATGQNPRVLKSGQQDLAFYQNLWNTILAGQVWRGELVNRRKDGSLYTEEMTIAPVRDAQGEISHFVAIKRDVTERKQAEEQIRGLNQHLERRARELASLNRAGQVMASTLDLDAVLWLVMDEITQLLGAEAASVLLQEGEELVFVASVGPGAATLSGVRMPVTSGIAGWVMREEKAVLVGDARSDPRFYDRVDATTGLTTRSLAAVPLVVKGVPRGVIEAINKAGGAFDEHDLTLLEGIASSAAIAIENARLFAAVDQELIERDRAEAEIRKLNQDLEEALRQEHKTRAQLIQAGKLSAMGRMVASVAHEFNNPLQTIKNCLFLIQQDLASGAQGIKFLDMAASEVQRLSDLVNQLRAVYRSGTADQMQAVELSEILDQVHSLVAPHLTKNRVRWEYTEPPHPLTVSGVPDQLKQVFLNLCLNASDAMQAEGGTLAVNVLSAADGRQVGVAFRDTGPGIDPSDLPSLFDPFFTTKESGMGLGLAICFDIVHKHGGQIEVESQLGQGATFTVWLPLAPS